MHFSDFALCSANARSDASFQGFGTTSAKIKMAQGNRPMGFLVIDIQLPPENCASGGLSEICGWL